MDKSGSLVKMIIVSYEKSNFKGDEKKFAIPVNPETFSRNYKVEYEVAIPPGTSGTDANFNSTAPEDFKIEFVLDGTDSIENYHTNVSPDKRDYVEEELKLFLETVYHMDGEIHRPRFCEIFFGKKVFQGLLSNLDVNYTLFHPDGKPLRVKIGASFLDYVAKDERERRMKKKSPDLSRIRRIKGGDKLEKMVYEFYGDSGFITQVARANNLTSFRKVGVGQELRFPPIDKKEETE